MDQDRFDGITREIADAMESESPTPRRRILTGIAGLFGLAVSVGVTSDAEAKATRRNKRANKNRRGKPRRNKQRKPKCNPEKLIEVCHKPGTPAEKTKIVNECALPAHLGHGDTKGPCKTPPPPPECPDECPETCDEQGKCPPPPPCVDSGEVCETKSDCCVRGSTCDYASDSKYASEKVCIPPVTCAGVDASCDDPYDPDCCPDLICGETSGVCEEVCVPVSPCQEGFCGKYIDNCGTKVDCGTCGPYQACSSEEEGICVVDCKNPETCSTYSPCCDGFECNAYGVCVEKAY